MASAPELLKNIKRGAEATNLPQPSMIQLTAVISHFPPAIQATIQMTLWW